jgi:hypothetical protein
MPTDINLAIVAWAVIMAGCVGAVWRSSRGS